MPDGYRFIEITQTTDETLVNLDTELNTKVNAGTYGVSFGGSLYEDFMMSGQYYGIVINVPTAQQASYGKDEEIVIVECTDATSTCTYDGSTNPGVASVVSDTAGSDGSDYTNSGNRLQVSNNKF